MKTSNKIVIIYDFDKTLTSKDMQEYGMLQDLGYENPSLFWSEVKSFCDEHRLDPVLGYMYKLMEVAKLSSRPLTQARLIAYGKQIEFVKGVDEWFMTIAQLSKALNITIEHVIVSSGLTKMIEGTSIAPYLTHIYGCEYVYNKEGEAIWAAVANNYTMKTQFIARIHKEAHDLSDHVQVNDKSSVRPVPYSHMVYIGDGFSDVASMRMIHEQGGLTLALYHGSDSSLAQGLLKDGRVHGVYEADYQIQSALYQKVASYISYIMMP
jgi:2-hydroxy-3-keto-5-methylthiopentenyl-1-phosphate phosphatase